MQSFSADITSSSSEDESPPVPSSAAAAAPLARPSSVSRPTDALNSFMAAVSARPQRPTNARSAASGVGTVQGGLMNAGSDSSSSEEEEESSDEDPTSR